MNIKTLWIASAALVASQVMAAPYSEIGDAGQTLGSARVLGGGIDVINGNVSAGTADLYSFNWGGGNFAADTVGSNFDTQLWLFDADGFGVWSNDDLSWNSTRSRITDWSLDAGQYFIGITGYDTDPFGDRGRLFNNESSNQQGPRRTNNSLEYWSGSSGGGRYTVNLNRNTASTSVPEPATLALLGMGLMGLGIGARRRQKA